MGGELDIRMEGELLVERGRQMRGGVLLVGLGKRLVEGTACGDVDTWADTHIMPSVGMRDHKVDYVNAELSTCICMCELGFTFLLLLP